MWSSSYTRFRVSPDRADRGARDDAAGTVRNAAPDRPPIRLSGRSVRRQQRQESARQNYRNNRFLCIPHLFAGLSQPKSRPKNIPRPRLCELALQSENATAVSAAGVSSTLKQFSSLAVALRAEESVRLRRVERRFQDVQAHTPSGPNRAGRCKCCRGRG